MRLASEAHVWQRNHRRSRHTSPNSRQEQLNGGQRPTRTTDSWQTPQLQGWYCTNDMVVSQNKTIFRTCLMGPLGTMGLYRDPRGGGAPF